MVNIRRTFFFSGLISFVIIAAALGIFVRQMVRTNLVEIAESKNVALTQAFSNSLWPAFAPLVEDSAVLSPEELRQDPRLPQLFDLVTAQLSGLSVVKIKVYNLAGITVFSTELAQIGENKLDNPGFMAARQGEVASELTHRDTFSAFEQTISDRDVFSSYLPIYDDGQIVGVFEVYDDVTPLVVRTNQVQGLALAGVFLLLGILFGFLIFVGQRIFTLAQKQYETVRQQEQALLQARDEALDASRMKTQLLANVSHDLRTPLNAILGYSEMLQEGVYGDISTQQQEAIAKIIDSVGHLLNFVNNMLDQAHLEAGKFNLNLKPVALLDLVVEVEELVKVLVEAKGLTLRSTIAPEMSTQIYGDRYWLRQILINLLGNSIKFTKEGSIDVKIYPSGADKWAIQVTDTGVGIPESAQESVFEPFWQLSGDKQKLGSGLGLSIVKQLVTLMDGDVRLNSIEGKGATFIITLPLQPVPEFVG